MKKGRTEIAHRYARAFFELARDENQLVETLEGFRLVSSISTDVLSMFSSPLFLDGEKRELLESLIQLCRLKSVLADGLRLLLANHRIELLGEICEEFQTMVDNSMGISRGTVTSAVPMDGAELSLFESELSGAVGKRVFLAPKVDEDLLAGYVVQVGTTLIDASLKTQLQNLRESLSRGVC